MKDQQVLLAQAIQDQINRIFVGKEDVVRLLLTCFLAGGHLLIEDVPGVGKTTLASCLAKAIQCTFGRIQFTPDTLPGDVTGISVYNMKTGEFAFRKGVVDHQILLADEINRTSPKTQSSLLEAMAERQVTIDGVTYPLPTPFMVIATQNPVEFLGTYPLPEAQMDRFLMRLSIGYPDQQEEIRMTQQFLQGLTKEQLSAVCDADQIVSLQEVVKNVTMQEDIIRYISDIISLTRKEERFLIGASPRAMLALASAAQANAFLAGRQYCKPDDVKKMALPVLCHRLFLTAEARMKQESIEAILKSIVLKAKVPILSESAGK
ncbi:MAG: MoxR family ATPase [Lachnospiraceae bacterium]|nr:MoxR family ATPase [Lachnospiraceae bacterium]